MLIVKVGGGQTINWEYLASDLAQIAKQQQVVLIHGASTKRDQIAQQLGHPTQTVTSPSGISSVFTDQPALEIFLMVYAGLINKQIVATLQSHGINAVGLSGVDGRLWEGKRKPHLYAKDGEKKKLLTGNFTGRVEQTNTQLIQILLDNGYTPVVCPPAISYQHEIINTDNDLAIAVVAGDLSADQLVVLFEAPGLLKDVNDETSLINQIRFDQSENYMKYAKGRMKKKLMGAQKALQYGVKTVYWGDARIEKPITLALQGQGTIISK